MPIDLSCDCGRALRVKDELAGKKIRCPQCKSILAVPTKEDEAEEMLLEVIADEDEEPAERRPRRPAIQAEPPKPPPAYQRSIQDTKPALKKAPKPRREKERRVPRVAFEEGWFGSINSGIVGGILMILIAIVWFVVGLTGGVIFFYPPILAVIGIIAIIKGCFSS
jgi:anti-sigma factor RsiW